MKSNLRNEIKSYIVRQGMTMQEVVDLLSDEYGWSDLSLIHIYAEFSWICSGCKHHRLAKKRSACCFDLFWFCSNIETNDLCRLALCTKALCLLFHLVGKREAINTIFKSGIVVDLSLIHIYSAASA